MTARGGEHPEHVSTVNSLQGCDDVLERPYFHFFVIQTFCNIDVKLFDLLSALQLKVNT